MIPRVSVGFDYFLMLRPMSNSIHPILLLVSIVLLAGVGRSAAADPSGSIEVEITGLVCSGLVRTIVGETTGVTISARGVTWELDFGQDAEARERVSKLGGKTVWVRGSLEPRDGVDAEKRWVVTVSELRPAEQEKGKPDLAVKSRRADSRIELSGAGSGGEVVATVESKSGIGSATLSRVGESWPKELVVRLHLRGLESFKVENGRTVVEWSKSSSGDQASRVSLRQAAGGEQALVAGSRYFSELKTVGTDPTVPLRDGYFEIALPAALLEDNPEEITLRWIDFYR
jgi:hypothetical protein